MGEILFKAFKKDFVAKRGKIIVPTTNIVQSSREALPLKLLVPPLELLLAVLIQI